jgi:PGF-pre-PGF domain-containing protein
MRAIIGNPVVFILIGVVIASLVMGGVYPTVADNKEYFYVGSPITYLKITSDNLIENDPIIHYPDEPFTGVSPPPDSVNVYFTIDAGVHVREATIKFQVRREWLELYRVPEDGVVLMKFNGDWGPLPTRVTKSTENDVVYEATAENFSFSVFAIVGRPVEEKLLLPLISVAGGIAAAALLYWFVVRPRKLFVSLKRLEKATGERVVRRKPGRLKEGEPEPRVKGIKPRPRRGIELEEDVRILKRLRRKAQGRRR